MCRRLVGPENRAASVMGGEDEQRKGAGTGFAGLSTLVSHVDTPLPSAAEAEPPSGAPGAGRALPRPQQAQPSQHQTYQGPAQPPSSGSSGGKWVLGIVAVVLWLWVFGQLDGGGASRSPAYSPTARSGQPSYVPPSAELQLPSRPQESLPAVGRDVVLSTAQIRYCLAENIRIEGARWTINKYIDSDVDRLNLMVVDFNNRCGSFRYRSGALEGARRDIEPFRSQIYAEGRERFARPSNGSMSTPAPVRSASDPTVQEIQQKLNEQGYEAGAADGFMGRATRSAIRAFQRDNGLAAATSPRFQ